MSGNLLDLIKKEKWEVKNDKVLVYGKEFPLIHPCLIHLKIYREEQNPELKYLHMKAAHDYMWPKDIPTWHSWTEERFKEHCVGYNYIGWAGGASCAKSYDAAKVALLFWFAHQKQRGVIIASTTLASLSARVWGYTTQLLKERAIKIPIQYMAGNSPMILYPSDKENGSSIKDTIHGIFAVAARQGSDESAINTWIGRHPKDALMLVLDECTDLNPAIAKAFTNLDSSEKSFQTIAIGNSSSWHDLHGSICYPKGGIESIDPAIDTKWETNHKNGICLFFSCYNSPAIHEQDPKKKKLLSKFLITEEQIQEKEIQYGIDSESFSRFVLGFWRNINADRTIVSKTFLEAFKVSGRAEWLGLEPLNVVAGLDPAFSSGGDACILRLAILGQTVDGGIVLDFRGDKLVFKIDISAKSGKATEIQIAEKVLEILERHNCNLKCLCIDANGQGRALGGTLQLQARSVVCPTKIYSVRNGKENVNSFDVKIMEPYELWMDLRKFIENNQIRGLDHIAMTQLTSRLIVTTDNNGKPTKPKLENKAVYKRRMGGIMPSLAHSPDEADAAALCLQSAILHYGFKLGQRKDVRIVNDFAHDKMVAFQRELKMEQQKKDTLPLTIRSGYSLGLTEFRKVTR